MNTVRNLLAQARGRLQAKSAQPALDAEVLLAHVLRRERSWLYAWPEQEPDADQTRIYERLITLRSQGRPVAHLTGEREFWSLRLRVSEDTLIPRPETELLVETALELDLPDHRQRPFHGRPGNRTRQRRGPGSEPAALAAR